MSRKCYIDNTTEHFPELHLEIGDYLYGFTIKDFPESKREWLLEVVERQMTEIHERAVRDTRKKVQENIKLAIGIM